MSQRRAIKKDKADDDIVRHGRDRHLGVCVSNEFYQRAPMFFSREAMNIELIGHYRGASAFLICNGPSFASLNHNLLRQPGIITYGMNNGPASFRPDFWTCVDTPARFLKSIWLDPKITKLVPMAHFEKNIFDNEEWKMQNIKVGDCPNVIGFRRNEKFMANRFLFEDCMNWGNHKDYGGCRTVILPCLHILFLLGFRKVYLLGCDLTMSTEYAYHFDEQRDRGAVSCNTATYRKMITEYFPQLKPFFDAEGFEIYNCNPNSALTVFPHVTFENAIAEATGKLGDTVNERTWGMYSKPEEKEKWKNEISDEQKPHLAVLKQLKGQKGQTPQTVAKRIPEQTNTTTTLPMQVFQPQPVQPIFVPQPQPVQSIPVPQPQPQPMPVSAQPVQPIPVPQPQPMPVSVQPVQPKNEIVAIGIEMEEQRRKLLEERQKHLAQKRAEIEQAQAEVQRQILEQNSAPNIIPTYIDKPPMPQVIPVQQKKPVNYFLTTSQQEG